MGDIVSNNLLFVYVGAGVLGLAFVFCIIGAVLARSRGRGAVRWGLLCLIFGLFAIIVLVCLPRVRRHPVWSRPEVRPTPESPTPATVNEEDAPTLRLTIGQRGSASRRYNSGQRAAERAIDLDETPLLAPRPPVSDVTLAETPRSKSAAPAVTPAQAPRSASPTPAPRRGRLPGVPAGYPDFQVLARGDTKIEVQCPSCGCVFRRLNSLMGKLEKCPDCRTVMRIPT